MRITLNLPLPYALPIKDGEGLRSLYEFASFRATFYRRKQQVILEGFSNETDEYTLVRIEIEASESSVPMGTPVEGQLWLGFTQAIWYLNSFLDSIRFGGQYPWARRIGIESLPPGLRIVLDGLTYAYVLPPKMDARSTVIDSPMLARIGERMGDFLRYPRRGAMQHFFAEAGTARVFEDFPEAVTNLETAFEVFIRNTCLLILQHSAKTELEIKRLLDAPFRNIIEHQFTKYLGTGFDLSQPGPMKEWFEALYSLRNRIVHEGYWRVNARETARAFDAHQGAVRFIVERLIAQGILDGQGRTKVSDVWPDHFTDADIERLYQRARETEFIPKDVHIGVTYGKDSEPGPE